MDIGDVRWTFPGDDSWLHLALIADAYERGGWPAPDGRIRPVPVLRGPWLAVPLRDGTWRRDDERHANTLIDTSKVPALLADHDVEAEVRSSFGDEDLPDGLAVIVGRRVSPDSAA